jgi:hypothetical protein
LVEAIGVAILTIYTAFTGFMFFANKRAADAAKSAADTATKQLELSDRAWIKIDAKPISFGGGILGSLPQLHVEMTYKNVGHSAALAVQTFPELYLLNRNEFETVMVAEEERFCGRGPINNAARKIGTLFPGEAYSVKYTSPNLGGKTTDDNTFGDFRKVAPVVIACVDYRYESSAAVHHTRAIYELLQPLGPHWVAGLEIGEVGNFASQFFTIDKHIAAENLFLRRVGAGDYAN